MSLHHQSPSVRVVLCGYDELLLYSLDIFHDLDAEVVAVVVPHNKRDDRAEMVRDEVRRRGRELIEQPPRAQTKPFAQKLSQLSPDILFAWSYPLRIPAGVIALCPGGAINMHMGLLPSYRGVHGIQAALMNGEKFTGVTLHDMEETFDTGPIIAQKKYEIQESDDVITLMRQARHAGGQLLREHWTRLADGAAVRQPQDEVQAGYRAAITAADRHIDWTRESVSIVNLVRALVAPFPGAFTMWRTHRLTVWRTRIGSAAENAGSHRSAEPGTIVGVVQDGLEVATGDGVLVIQQVDIFPPPHGLQPADLIGQQLT